MPPDNGQRGTRARALPTPFSRSPIVNEALARDLAACSSPSSPSSSVDDSAPEDGVPGPTLYRRPSGVGYGVAFPIVNDLSGDAGVLSARERARSRGAERDLLRDNHILPEVPPPATSFFSRVYRRVFGGEADGKPSGEREREPLLAGGEGYDDAEMNQQWIEAVAAGRVRTGWGREVKTMGGYAAPLLLALLLQYSVNVVSIFAVGKIGKMELGAVSRTSPSLSPLPPQIHLRCPGGVSRTHELTNVTQLPA